MVVDTQKGPYTQAHARQQHEIQPMLGFYHNLKRDVHTALAPVLSVFLGHSDVIFAVVELELDELQCIFSVQLAG